MPNASSVGRDRRTLSTVLPRLIARTTETLLPAPWLQQIRTKRDWKRWVESLTPELLQELPNSQPELKRQLFKANVLRVEIETHAKCNRVCSFCPNSIMDRRRDETLTDREMLDRVFSELGSIDYNKQICVARYSEPLANRNYLYERMASARSLAPHAELSITTNTDYLTPAVLDRLIEAGLNVIYMSIYLKANERWSSKVAHTYSDRLARKLKVKVETEVETSTTLARTYKYKNLHLRSTCHNWDQFGADRGGIIQIYTKRGRVGPCRNPYDTFIIDHSGSVMPCCNLRSDIAQHRDFIVGDLSVPGTSIFDIYAGRLASWRRGLVSFGAESFPCASCRHRDLPQELLNPIDKQLKQRLHKIDCGDAYRPAHPAPSVAAS
jgi:Iron-sulfur cluster-binding domain